MGSTQRIHIGDEVSVCVLEASEADKPIIEMQSSKEGVEKSERRHWEYARECYFKHRSK